MRWMSAHDDVIEQCDDVITFIFLCWSPRAKQDIAGVSDDVISDLYVDIETDFIKETANKFLM